MGIADFNPRSREGSDKDIRGQCKADAYFNPRSREGSDHDLLWILQKVDISIHAPAKGAT